MSEQTNNRTPLLEVRNLETAFPIDGEYHNAVDGVSFTVDRGRIVGVVGESGCGKSVMSLSIMHLLPKGVGKIQGGQVLLDGKDITYYNEKEMNKIRGKDMSMIFQEPMTALNPVFTIGFQLEEVLFNHFKISSKEARQKSVSLLRSVGISRPDEVVEEYPHQLSGGMRQRVMIAMAIACQPQLLIADEPTTALDVTVQAQILDLLKEVQSINDMAIVLITHDLGVVAEMCDDVMVMYAGEIVEKTSVEELFENPKHPYTQKLIDSIPRMDQKQDRLGSIQGIVPSLQNMPRVGCKFADRCPMAMPECKTITPLLNEIKEDHEVACILYDESRPKERANA